jgi:hypothetical protein
VKQVKFTRDMRPYQANHEAALPDALAEQLIASGEAVAVAPREGDVKLAQEVAAPRGRYLTRRK